MSLHDKIPCTCGHARHEHKPRNLKGGEIARDGCRRCTCVTFEKGDKA